MPKTADSTYYYQNITPYQGEYKESLTLQKWAQTIPELVEKDFSSKVYRTGVEKKEQVGNWVPLLLLVGLISIAFAKSVYQKRFSMLFQTLLNWKLSKQIIRYEKVYTHPVNILMTFNFILCFTLFFGIIRSMHFSNMNTIGLSSLIILLPLLIYLLIKLVIYKFSGWLLNEKFVVEEYIFQTNLFNKYLGVVFLGLTILLIYSSIDFIVLSYLGIIILIFSLLFQIIRGIMVGIENGKSLFFIILYLCTLEILPWLMIGKWINNQL